MDEEDEEFCDDCGEYIEDCCCNDEPEGETMNYPGDYYGLKLVNHGGLCCGIKTIYGFYGNPKNTVGELPACPGVNNGDAYGRQSSSNERFFTDEAPSETYEERVDRYIEFIKRRRPQHLIEVVFEHNQLDCYGWRPWLKKHRFRKVSTFLNSNSGNYVTVYHKAIGQPKKAKPKADPFA
jgi:hypothetical protein